MGTISRKDDSNAMQPVHSPAVLLIGIIADTTWRMFVPTIGATILGVYLDTQLSTKPWLTTLGIIVGTSIALALVLRQLRSGK
jgi:hypothetical protein